MAVWLAMHACDLKGGSAMQIGLSPYAEQNPDVFGRIVRLKHCDEWMNVNSIMGYFTILNLPPLLVQEFDVNSFIMDPASLARVIMRKRCIVSTL